MPQSPPALVCGPAPRSHQRTAHSRGTRCPCPRLCSRPVLRKVASLPRCKIRLGTNGETSRVSTQKFTESRHEKRSCKYMEEMYCDNDSINMTPTRCSVLNRVCIWRWTDQSAWTVHRKSRTTFTTRLLHHCENNMYHERSWLLSSTLDSVEGRVWTALRATESRGCQ